MIPSRVFIIYDILNMVSTMSRHVRVVVSFLLLLSCAMRFMQYDSMSDFAWGAVLISRLLHAHIACIHRAALRVMTLCSAVCSVFELKDSMLRVIHANIELLCSERLLRVS